MEKTVKYIGFTFDYDNAGNLVLVGLFQGTEDTFYITVASVDKKDIIANADLLGTSLKISKIKKFIDKKISKVSLENIKKHLKENFTSLWYFLKEVNI